MGLGRKIVLSSAVAATMRQSSFGMLTGAECLKTQRVQRLFVTMNLTGVTGVTEGTIATLKAFGAVKI
jgi:hypothetical protein